MQPGSKGLLQRWSSALGVTSCPTLSAWGCLHRTHLQGTRTVISNHSDPFTQVYVSRISLETRSSTKANDKSMQCFCNSGTEPWVTSCWQYSWSLMERMEALSSHPFSFYLSCCDCAQEKNISLSSSKSWHYRPASICPLAP